MQVFGLASLMDKELVVGRDMPEDMASVLKQELLQAMITGEKVSVPCKGKGTLDLPWQSHLILVSNYLFNYRNDGGQFSRRIAFFVFSKRIPTELVDPTLLARIKATELPALAARALGAYHRAAEQHRASSFWSWCPPELRKVRDSMSASMSPIEHFLGLTEDDEEFDFYFRKNEGSYVHYNTLVHAYNEYLQRRREMEQTFRTREVLNDKTLETAGYTVHLQIHTCRECGNLVRKPRICCERSHPQKRNTAKAVKGLELVRKPPQLFEPAPDDID